MKAPKTLLWDFETSSGLGSALREVLVSSSLNGDLWYESPKIERIDGDVLTTAISSFSPSLIFFVVPSGSFEHLRRMLQLLRQRQFTQTIIVAAEHFEPGEMVELVRLGVTDCVTAPFDSEGLLRRIQRAVELEQGSKGPAEALEDKLGLEQIVGESPLFLAEVEKLHKVAACDVSVLISGETGTGKEVFAKAIHRLSQRGDKVFIAVNCGAIPMELVENELFGHERGAYTGASSSQHGLIREASGGTLFLDEIDSLPLMAQVKLLRLLQEKEYRPLGSAKTLKADVRIISASSVNLKKAIIAGKLRQDLYYRLNVVSITLPPLRQRQQDIVPLARHFLIKYAGEFNRPAKQFSAEALLKLTSYDWPGNVRELEHTIERAVVLSNQDVIQDYNVGLAGSEAAVQEPFQKAKARMISQFEKDYIRNLLLVHDGNITRAANTAKKDRRAFVHLIRKHKIAAHEFKQEASKGR